MEDIRIAVLYALEQISGPTPCLGTIPELDWTDERSKAIMELSGWILRHCLLAEYVYLREWSVVANGYSPEECFKRAVLKSLHRADVCQEHLPLALCMLTYGLYQLKMLCEPRDGLCGLFLESWGYLASRMPDLLMKLGGVSGVAENLKEKLLNGPPLSSKCLLRQPRPKKIIFTGSHVLFLDRFRATQCQEPKLYSRHGNSVFQQSRNFGHLPGSLFAL